MFKAILVVLVMAVSVNCAVACDRDAFVIDDMTYVMSDDGAIVFYDDLLDNSGNIVVKYGLKIHTIVEVGSECEFNMLKEFTAAGYAADVSVEFTYTEGSLYDTGVKRCWNEGGEVKCAEYNYNDYDDFLMEVRNIRLK